jgi:hypothetical protein
MRDLARRVQSLRKELGFRPTDVLDVVYLAGLDDGSRRLLEPFVGVMAGLVRARDVRVVGDRDKVSGVDWCEFVFDDRRVFVAVGSG